MDKILCALALWGILLSATPVFADTQICNQNIIKHALSTSVEKAVELLEADLKAKGLTIFARIDHAAAAKENGLTMKPAVVIIFGNPKVGTELMNANMAWSYELPLKIAIYEDNTGTVWAQTRILPQDINTPGQEKRLKAINNLLTKLVQITQ